MMPQAAPESRARTASDADWIGDVPNNWDVVLLRLVARIESGHTPSRSHPEYWVPSECVIPWFSLADIWQLRDGSKKFLGETSECVSALGIANSAARVLPAGTVVLSRTASVGFSGIMPRPMATTQDFVNWVCGPRILPDFLLWTFRAMQPYFKRLMMGSTHQTIYMPDLRQFRGPIPPLQTQQAIADFLDRKTAAIDALIAKKQKLLDLLAEKRSALINQAVTKGLNPNVPMKDSGIPWIGEIPAHWSMVALSWYSRVFNGSTPSRARPDFWEGNVPWVASGKVNDWAIQEPTARISEAAQICHGLRVAPAGSVVIGMVGEGRTRGMSARLGIETCINQNMAAIVPSPRLDFRYLHYALTQGYEGIREFGRGGQQDALNCAVVGALRIPFPALSEQRDIAALLDSQKARHDSVANGLIRQIERLREYRQALITAAVAGQICIPERAVA